MSEIGIQLDGSTEAWRQRPAIMRRPVSRRPRVNEHQVRKHTSLKEAYAGQRLSKWKRDQLGRGSMQESRPTKILFDEGMVPFEIELNKVNNANSVPIDDSNKPRLKRSGSSVSSGSKRESRKHVAMKSVPRTGPITGPNDEASIPKKIGNEDGNISKANGILPTTHKNRHPRGRAMSYDDVFRQRSASVQYAAPGFPVKPNSVEDAGSQIINSYSGYLEYEENIPRSTKRRGVKSFFRRLAGSLESLLRIGRKTKHRHSFHDYNNSDNLKSYNNPLFANYSPYISVDDCIRPENDYNMFQQTSSKQKTVSPQPFCENASAINNTRGMDVRTFTSTVIERTDSKRIAFSRGKRIYRSPVVQLDENQGNRRNPIPPSNVSAGRRRRNQKPISRTKLKGFAIVGNGKADDEWETRSETDSESCMFRSNNLQLADINFTVSSESETVGDTIAIKDSNSQEEGTPKGSQAKLESKDNSTSKRIKISDFFPKPTSRKSETNVSEIPEKVDRKKLQKEHKKLGPMKAYPNSTGMQDVLIRTASAGKFDVIPSKNVRKRRVRRRNSSFLPGNQKENMEIEKNIQQAASFEEIMGSLQEIVDNLGRVHVKNVESEASQKVAQNDETDGASTKNSNKECPAPTKNQNQTTNLVKRKKVRRQESWVGAVSNRLDKLIDSGGRKKTDTEIDIPPSTNKQTGAKQMNKTAHTGERNPEFQSTVTHKAKRSFIKCEKVSFDDLEKDFRNFAREIRQRKSTENMSAIGK
ncbi:uncharacterized protein LOC144420866 [Styela clava]